MKILLVIGSLGAGGAERVATTLVNAWSARGDSVTLVSTFSGRGECFYPLADDVQLVYLADQVRTVRRGLINFIDRLFELRSLIRKTKPDVIISFLTHVNITVIAASCGLRIPVIACEHTNPLVAKRGLVQRLLARLLYPEANLLTVLTEGVVASFKTQIPRLKRVAVVPNPLPLDPARFERSKRPDRLRRRLIAVGRLQELKQFNVLITAFAALASEFPDWDLHVWGEGPARPELEQLVAREGLQQRAMLSGSTPSVWNEMAHADAFALTSRFEGLPMAMMEAMAIGLPCVAFDCPSGPRELTRDGEDGVLVPPNDLPGLVTALRRVFSDQVLRAELGRKAASSVCERYSVGRILGLWDQLFVRVGATTENV